MKTDRIQKIWPKNKHAYTYNMKKDATKILLHNFVYMGSWEERELSGQT